MTTPTITSLVFEGEATVRATVRKQQPWFFLADVCRVVRLVDQARILDGLDDKEKATCSIDISGVISETPIISQTGLVKTLLQCQDALQNGSLPHRFMKWITNEVAPALFINAAPWLSIEPAAPVQHPHALNVRLVTEARHSFGRRVAADLWFTLGLPRVPAMQLELDQHDLFWPGHRTPLVEASPNR